MANNNRQRMINTKFWSDSFVVDKLNPLDRYLFLYFLTNEKTNLSGVYELPIRTIANETGLEKEEVLRMIERLKGKVEYKNGWVCLVNFTKHQNNENGSIVKGIENRLKELPNEVREWVNKLRNKTSGIPVVDEWYTRGEQPNLTKPNLTKLKNTVEQSSPSPFLQFWTSYPKRENKKGCETKWKKEKYDSQIKEILIFIENAKETDRWKKGFIKAPLVFLNQESWNDDLESYNDINKSPKGIMKF